MLYVTNTNICHHNICTIHILFREMDTKIGLRKIIMDEQKILANQIKGMAIGTIILLLIFLIWLIGGTRILMSYNEHWIFSFLSFWWIMITGTLIFLMINVCYHVDAKY